MVVGRNRPVDYLPGPCGAGLFALAAGGYTGSFHCAGGVDGAAIRPIGIHWGVML